MMVPLAHAHQGRSHVVLISVDGLRPDRVLNARALGLALPNLERMLKDGSYASAVKGVYPTLTYPSHTTMVTGLNPHHHGILNNLVFDPFQEHKGAWHWYAEEIKGNTLWKAAKAKGLVTASVDFPVTVGLDVDFLIPQYWRDGTAIDSFLLRSLSTKGLLEPLERKWGPFESWNWYVDGDRKRVRFLVDILEERRPHFMTGYFASVDEMSHLHGYDSKETADAMMAVDGFLGEIMAGLDHLRASTGEEWTLCVVSDHGFANLKKEIRPNVLLQEHGLITVNSAGKLTSWKAFAWDAEGMAAIYLNPALEVSEREGVTQVVRQLLTEFKEKNPGMIADVWEGKEKIEAQGGFTGAAFLVTAAPAHEMTGNLAGPVVVDTPRFFATHGFTPENPDMNASFFIEGAGIAKGRNLGRINMVDIAPTLAPLLGLDLGPVDGKNILPAEE